MLRMCNSRLLPVLPYPRETRWDGDGEFEIEQVRVQAAGEDSACAPALAILRQGLGTMAGSEADRDYTITVRQTPELVDSVGPEGYELSIARGGSTLAAAAAPGLYYASQTFLQLLHPRPRGACLAGGTVRDWPLKQVRGVHSYLPARSDLPFFRRFIEWLGRHKLNTLVLEIGGGMEYRRHPEINRAWETFCREADAYPGGPCALQASQWFLKNSTHTELAGGSWLTQDEVRQIKEWCAANCIEIMPEVQSLSHAYYLVLAHPELAEVAEDPWPDNYCPSNPESYELYFDVLDEVVEVLQPKTVSIGHDEAYIFNFCPRCQHRDAAEIYATDITKSRDYLAARGIRTAIWGDKLLDIQHANGASYGGVERDLIRYGKRFYLPPTKRCVELIPQDVLIFDWYWSLSYDSAAMLAEKGFEMIYGNFHAPSFQDWAKYRENPALLGGETSMWCAPEFYAIGRNGCFHNILWAANNLWSDFDPDADRDRIRADIACALRHDRIELGQAPSVLNAPGETRQRALDLTGAASGQGAPGGTPDLDLGVLPRGRQVLGNVEFALVEDTERPAVFTMVNWHTGASPPIPIGCRADALAFLHTTTAQRVHAPTYYSLQLGPNTIGAYLITYADGEQVEVPLEYGRNIDAFNSEFMRGKSGDQSPTIGAFVYEADPVLTGLTTAGNRFSVFMYEWVNPRPEVMLSEVRLLWRAGYCDGVLVLLAATVITRSAPDSTRRAQKADRNRRNRK